jgi:hypothetical protein
MTASAGLIPVIGSRCWAMASGEAYRLGVGSNALAPVS